MRRYLPFFIAVTLSLLTFNGCQDDSDFSLDPIHRNWQLKESEVKYAQIRANNFIAVWEEEFEVQPLASKLISPLLPDIDLKAMIIEPPGNKPKPTIFLFHGGAFIPGIGSYKSSEMVNWAKFFASRGFVAISVEYRDANLMTPSWIKAGYCATQDAKAALRFFANHKEQYHINTDKFYLAGISAGAITALNAAFLDRGEGVEFMEEKLDRIYGALNAVGEPHHQSFIIKGVINICGAAFDLDMLNNNSIPVISVHGKRDRVLPYNCGMPFEAYSIPYNKWLSRGISLLHAYPALKSKLKRAKSFEICGGAEIHRRLQEVGTPSQLIPIGDEDHTFMYSQNAVLSSKGQEILKESLLFLNKN